MTAPTREDLAELGEQFPAWRIGTVCTTRDSGPEHLRITASRDGVLLTAWNRAEMASKIKYEESQMGAGC